MTYLRRFADHPTDPAVHQPEFLVHAERCSVVKGGLPAGSQADPPHRHPMDQFYFILEGEIGVQLGSTRFTATPDTLVRVPAGTPHYAFNETDRHAVQLELLLPTPVPASRGKLVPLVELVDDLGGPAPDGCQTIISPDGWAPTGDPSREFQKLADRATGSASGFIAAVRASGPGSEPEYHVHPFDELAFVIAGQMTVDVALDRYELGRHDLVVLPAGVPHRAWAAGPERHLSIITPEPADGDLSTWTIPVEFQAAA